MDGRYGNCGEFCNPYRPAGALLKPRSWRGRLARAWTFGARFRWISRQTLQFRFRHGRDGRVTNEVDVAPISPASAHHCKFTGMITYRKFGPPFSKPGRLGAVSSSEISSLSTTRKASVRNVGLKPIST